MESIVCMTREKYRPSAGSIDAIHGCLRTGKQTLRGRLLPLHKHDVPCIKIPTARWYRMSLVYSTIAKTW